ncbi:MAG: tripartite tricarboxylate transporter substrate binding protein [Pigmentiphaga sp.]|uniref:Bug family tripartite tricarboxylate transporter substrate binding protein n=1 Tax=Pigmentiphaga sp. TaxID=1977564 RepID=UPI0029BA4ABC|nr:tripartite tricarboxylate transporter substrate binding protein [Pigmentiphaga sp.]MDX3904341.1 tripartite tricarboxylate transporter substrate binding protein [Pigmentiphaga sp.]
MLTRTLSKILLAAFAAAVIATPARSADTDYPARYVTIINPFAPGGPTDVVARPLARILGDALGQQIIIENKAGGAIAASQVARAKPDGYTLFLATGAALIVTPLLQKTDYEGWRDFDYLGMAAYLPSVLVVNPSVQANTVRELVDLAKREPGKLNFASSGQGSSSHLGGEAFRKITGTDIIHVPYKGAAPAVTDLVAGVTSMALLNLTSVLPHIKSGKLRALAFAGKERSALIPDVPTFSEAGLPGFELASWYVLATPKHIPPAVLQVLRNAWDKAMANEEYRATIVANGGEIRPYTAEQTARYVEEESERTRTLIPAAQSR